jgi:hypothetical protein
MEGSVYVIVYSFEDFSRDIGSQTKNYVSPPGASAICLEIKDTEGEVA